MFKLSVKTTRIVEGIPLLLRPYVKTKTSGNEKVLEYLEVFSLDFYRLKMAINTVNGEPGV